MKSTVLTWSAPGWQRRQTAAAAMPGHGYRAPWHLASSRDAGRASGRQIALLERLYRHRSREGGQLEDLAIRRLGDETLLAAVRQLPKRPRTVVALRFGAGLSYREIGDQLGLSEAAALMAVRRALGRLRTELESKEAH